VVLYGCETWSLILREECRLRAFENRVLRRIFGSKTDEVTRGWRKLHNEKLHNLYYSPSIIRMIRSGRMIWAGHVAQMEKRNAYRILVGKPEAPLILSGYLNIGKAGVAALPIPWRCRSNNIEVTTGIVPGGTS
jgi:hypothetical protein